MKNSKFGCIYFPHIFLANTSRRAKSSNSVDPTKVRSSIYGGIQQSNRAAIKLGCNHSISSRFRANILQQMLSDAIG